MHSRYRISNSSDSHNLDVGVPTLQKLSSDKYGEEVRIYCEPTVECQRLRNLDEDRLSSTTETLLVEPHYFNLTFSPLTSEFIAHDKKRKLKAENAQNNNHLLDPAVKLKEESKPVSQSKLERLKNLDKKSSKENLADRRSKAADQTPMLVKKEGPDTKLPPAAFPPKMPPLPTAPIPASELPPQSMRLPPPKALAAATNIPAALSSLTPIPLKDLNRSPAADSGPPTAATAPPQAAAASGSIAIQVPLQGTDGTTIMQTINVPKSVLAGASERPVLLTVTPKNGVNKGQKQIVMLTRNASGLAATMRTLPAGESPSKVVLTQRAPPPPPSTAAPSIAAGGQTTAVVRTAATGGVGVIQYGGGSGAGGNKPGVTDIKALLSQVKPVPTSELAGKVIVNASAPGGSASSSKPVVGLSSASLQQRAVFLQATSNQQHSSTVTQQQSSQQAQGTTIVQQSTVGGGAAGQQNTGVQQQQGTKTTVVPRQVIQQLIRPGQVITNSQQIILQDGKRVILQPARTGANDQVPGAARILLTQKGQVLQGAQAQALAGKIINTSQGQFIVGPNGQLLSTRKLIQNHLTNQTVRYVAISQPSSSGAALISSASSAAAQTSGSVVLQQSGTSGRGAVQQQGGSVQKMSPRLLQQEGSGAVLPGSGSSTGVLQQQPGAMSQSRVQIVTASGHNIVDRSTTNVLASAVPVTSGGYKAVTTLAGSNQVTTTVASSTPGRVTVAIPIIHSGVSPGQQQQQLVSAAGKPVQLSQVNTVQQLGQISPVKATSGILGSASPGGTTVLLNTVPGSTAGLTVRTPLPGGGHAIRAQLPTGGQVVRGQLSGASQVLSGGGVAVRTPVSAVRTLPVTPGARSLQANSPTVVAASPGTASTVRPGGSSQSTSAFNQMFLNALSNRGLLSQQNGKFVYVGDKNKSPAQAQPASSTSTVSIPVSSFDSSLGVNSRAAGVSLGVGAGSPAHPTMSVKPGDSGAAGDKNIVQVVVSAPNLDSFTASPRLLRMASSLMENPTIAELINTPCETSDAQNLNNGDINIYGVKTPGSVTTSLCDKASLVPRTFYYRDPRLPNWYVAVDISNNSLATNVSYTYYTEKGEKLRSPSEVAHYLKNKLVLLPSCKNIPPPRPMADIPLLTDLPPGDRVHVKELVLPVVDEKSPVIRQIETEIITHHNTSPGKRPGQAIGNIVEQKKPKIVFF